MRYDADINPIPYIKGKYTYITVDGKIAPAVQRLDTDEGWVECAAVEVKDNKLLFYFDFVKDNYVILLREGKVELHTVNFTEWQEISKKLPYIKPLTSELNENCRTTL